MHVLEMRSLVMIASGDIGSNFRGIALLEMV